MSHAGSFFVAVALVVVVFCVAVAGLCVGGSMLARLGGVVVAFAVVGLAVVGVAVGVTRGVVAPAAVTVAVAVAVADDLRTNGGAEERVGLAEVVEEEGFLGRVVDGRRMGTGGPVTVLVGLLRAVTGGSTDGIEPAAPDTGVFVLGAGLVRPAVLRVCASVFDSGCVADVTRLSGAAAALVDAPEGAGAGAGAETGDCNGPEDAGVGNVIDG